MQHRRHLADDVGLIDIHEVWEDCIEIDSVLATVVLAAKRSTHGERNPDGKQ